MSVPKKSDVVRIKHGADSYVGRCLKVREVGGLTLLDFSFEGFLLAGHIVELSVDGAGGVPGLVRSVVPHGKSYSISVEVLKEWR